MKLGLIDLRILKYMVNSPEEIFYVNDISDILCLKPATLRVRLKYLCKINFIKEVSVYPRYYILNPRVMDRIKARGVEQFIITPKL